MKNKTSKKEFFADRSTPPPIMRAPEIEALFKKLFPLLRSLTGNGVKRTYELLNQYSAFKILKIPSGKKCFDWNVPLEWNIKAAYIEDEKGNRIIDFKNNNLHVLNYSQPVNKLISYDELKDHLFTLPDLPDAIPYRTSYYNDNWGFCLTHNQFKQLDKTIKYRAVIDSNFKKGNLLLGEYLHPGRSKKEYIFSTYSCHPSLGNDNLSGMALWIILMQILKKYKTNYTYRFLIWPETIGAIAYFSSRRPALKNAKGAFVLTTVAGPDKIGYKKSFFGEAEIDQAVFKTLAESKIEYLPYDFNLRGSDERQFSMPGIRIPAGIITKSKFYEYPYYHTSLDNLDYIKPEYLLETLKIYLSAIEKLEMNFRLESKMPYCEPNLGKRGLYPKIGGSSHQSESQKITTQADIDLIKWIMFLADGKTTILDASEKLKTEVKKVYEAARLLEKNGLLKLNPVE